MMEPRVTRMSDGGIRLSELAPWFVDLLLELPDLLDSDQPEAVSQRLYPDPSDDEEQKRDWEKLVRPELFALVRSAREVVLEGLRSMGADEGTGGRVAWNLDIPATHIQAWISALNVARLTLFEKFEVCETEMKESHERDPGERDEKRIAIARIHLLGYLQQMLIEEESPTPEGWEDPR